MDPLTHTFVGAALARTPLGRTTRYAGLTLIVGANLPDIDVLSFVAGTDASMAFRRGWTHGVAAMAVLPALLFLSVLAGDRVLRRGRASPLPLRPVALAGLACLATWTHPLLDWLNTYGIRLLMPFDERWFYGDSVFIVDPWLWLILGGSVYLSRPRSREGPWIALAIATSLLVLLAHRRIPAIAPAVWLCGVIAIAWLGRRPAASRLAIRVATTGLLAATAYVLAMVATSHLLHARVERELTSAGVGPVARLMVAPLPADPLHWEFVAETAEHYRFGTLAAHRAGLTLDPRAIDRPRPSPVVDAALRSPEIRGTLSWMRFPFVEVEREPGGYTVFVLDARYVKSRTRGFGGVAVRLDRDLRARPAQKNQEKFNVPKSSAREPSN